MRAGRAGLRRALAALALAVLAAPALAQGRPPAEREMIVVNELGLSLRELYVAPAGEADPGPDRLGADTLPSGATLRLRLGRNQPCLFSLRAVAADGTVQERRGVDLCRGTRVTLGDPAAPLREASVVNETDQTIRQLYASPPGASERGPDRLGAAVVPPGRTFRLSLGRTRACAFDVVAVMVDGSEVERPGTDLCRAPRVVVGDPALPWREVEVRNRSGRVIRELFAAPSGAAGWGGDRLGTETVPEDGSWRLRLRQAACEADLRAVYDDLSAEERRGVDLCAGEAVVLDRAGVPRPPERALALVNRHAARVEEVYVSSSTDGDWGPERAPGGIGRNDRVDLSLPVACEVDLRVVFANGAAEERRELDVCASPLVVLRQGWTLAARLDGDEAEDGPRPGSVRLRNGGPLPIVELYLDEPGTPRGADRLGATVLGLDETLDLAPPEGGACQVRLVAVFRDGREVEAEPFDLCAGAEVPLR